MVFLTTLAGVALLDMKQFMGNMMINWIHNISTFEHQRNTSLA